ncbi:hypothetical protein CVV26_01960 [Candidatus Kuenenbacteria bacterium HGW-Kuenenbacteria-1]|uniref:Prepilin-type N-terminal cleavage/methylation domain-containing protein n=1 Tax=Candidatus Kuenenbacteria bacterium HGW-Kuenenbacteria-1 TaxID=2013812 RepID=A0A2N1UNK6_9BACT|nr:MAG: hypothetical protein CVV26_01960 [Candidatus Kuenenbacteria bacterium HGW-Kuenenbacteria-1]
MERKKQKNNKIQIQYLEVRPLNAEYGLQRGFSLVELTVAVAIFSMIIISAGNIFIQILKTQKEMLSKQILIDEGRYIMESMMKDIRMGYGFKDNITDRTQINFTRYNDKEEDEKLISTGVYCLAGEDGVCVQSGTYLAKTGNQVISSEKVSIKNLEFYIDKTNQPQITVILTLEPRNYRGTKPLLRLQNTVSQRCLKTTSACGE